MSEQMLLVLQGEWKTKFGDSREVVEKTEKLTAFLKANMNEEASMEADNLACEVSCLQELQGFTQGFQCAVTLLMGGVAV